MCIRQLCYVVCLLCFPLFAVASINQITNLRLQRHPHHIRLLLDATKNIHYHAFSLSNPSRVVIDIKEARFVRFFEKSLLLLPSQPSFSHI